MLSRDIYKDFYDNSGPTLEEKIVLAARRLCFVFAGCALVLGVLDIAGIRSFDGAVEFAASARSRMANLGDSVRTGVSEISITPLQQAVRVAIPQVSLGSTASKSDSSALDALADARKQDALALAMTSPDVVRREAPAPKPAPLPFVSVASAAPTMPVTTMPLASVRTQPFPSIPDLAAKSENVISQTPPVRMTSLPQAAIEAPPVAPSAPIAAPIAIPLAEVPLPTAKPPLSPANRLNLTGKEYARAERCLANAVYFEARSEPLRGQMAVAQVVVNRVFSGFYPNDVCGVVYQNSSRRLACQFTFACDGKSKAITERGAWARANRIARQTLDGQIYVAEVGKSTHYHASYVHPNWVREMHKLVRFGIHSFYRPYAWGNGAENPSWGTAANAHSKTRTATR